MLFIRLVRIIITSLIVFRSKLDDYLKKLLIERKLQDQIY